MKKTAILMVPLILGALASNAQAQQVERVTQVIPGKFARSGSSNRQPFNDETLKDLCEQGYTLAVYVYKGARDHEVTCNRGKISYFGMTNWEHPGSILEKASSAMKAGGKVMVHCWYGVHASNFVSAAALNRFCGYSGSQAAKYFLSGVPKGSLTPGKISKMAAELRALGPGGSVMDGCPSP
jgi:hypothetical protein